MAQTPAPSGGCPISAIAEEFNPFSDSYQQDPYSVFARARREEPIFFSPAVDAFVVTRYEDVTEVLKQPETFSAAPVADFITPPCEAAMGELITAGFIPGGVLVNEDDPEHRIHRGVLRNAFAKHRMDALEPKLRTWISGYCDAFVKTGKADLVADFMWEIPALAAFELIGVPDCEVERVKEHAASRAELNFGRPSEAEQIEHARGFGAFWQWCERHVERLSEEPNDTFMSEMIELSKQPEYTESLPRDWVVRMCLNLLFAGHETTTSGAGNAFHALLTNRDQWDRLVEDPTLIRNAVDETLRFYSAAPLWRRRTTHDTTLGGVRMPAGSVVFAAFGSANRDDAHFPAADRLDVSRENARSHLTFGWGRHKCLGQALARREIALAIEEIVTRIPHIQLVPDQEIDFSPNIIFRGPNSLLAEWDPSQNPRPDDRP